MSTQNIKNILNQNKEQSQMIKISENITLPTKLDILLTKIRYYTDTTRYYSR